MAEFKQIELSEQDKQFIEQRAKRIEEVCSLFAVPCELIWGCSPIEVALREFAISAVVKQAYEKV